MWIKLTLIFGLNDVYGTDVFILNCLASSLRLDVRKYTTFHLLNQKTLTLQKNKKKIKEHWQRFPIKAIGTSFLFSMAIPMKDIEVPIDIWCLNFRSLITKKEKHIYWSIDRRKVSCISCKLILLYKLYW